MMAVHTSSVEPLPHQISAVYESMLSKQPLRFLLADDPGAGKTIMAGLLIKELAMRSDARKVLVVSPGGLAAQWQDELLEKFDLHFVIFSRQKTVPLETTLLSSLCLSFGWISYPEMKSKGRNWLLPSGT